MVPLFPELRKELERLQEVVNPGIEIPLSSYVVPSYRSTEINLRKALLKIGRDAGVAEWPKPFMALRASRRTELERERRFPITFSMHGSAIPKKSPMIITSKLLRMTTKKRPIP